MRSPKASWVRALRALTANEDDDIRFNEVLGRWEFVLTSADGIMRSQFWCQFKNPLTGEPIPPDPYTGLAPFRELTDEAMIEALANLEKTFVGSAFDGAGTTQKEVLKRHKYNQDLDKKRWRDGGQAFADMTCDVGGYGRRLRGSLAAGYAGSPAQRTNRKLVDSTS